MLLGTSVSLFAWGEEKIQLFVRLGSTFCTSLGLAMDASVGSFMEILSGMRNQLGGKAYGKEHTIMKICWAEQPLKYISNGEMPALVSWESTKGYATSGCQNTT